jgi:hypothetical protein
MVSNHKVLRLMAYARQLSKSSTKRSRKESESRWGIKRRPVWTTRRSGRSSSKVYKVIRNPQYVLLFLTWSSSPLHCSCVVNCLSSIPMPTDTVQESQRSISLLSVETTSTVAFRSSCLSEVASNKLKKDFDRRRMWLIGSHANDDRSCSFRMGCGMTWMGFELAAHISRT